MKTKKFPLEGHNYRLRKMGVDEGSHIFMRMMGAIMEARSSSNYAPSDEPSEEDGKKLTDEERARALCGLALMRGLSFEDAKFARHNALLAIDRLEELPTGETAMPVLLQDGRWVPAPPGWPDLEEQASTRQSLELEALVFSLTPFFSKAGAAS